MVHMVVIVKKKKKSLLNLRFHNVDAKKKMFLEIRENEYRTVRKVELVALSQNCGVRNFV